MFTKIINAAARTTLTTVITITLVLAIPPFIVGWLLAALVHFAF